MKKNSRKTNNEKRYDMVLFKASIIFFFVVIFIGCFFCFDGTKIFETSTYVDSFAGYEFQIHSIDVENGDAFLLRLPQNKTMLIDCGEEKYSSRVVSYVKQYMAREKLQQIDYFVITHPDSDHCGGAEQIFKNFIVKTFYRPKIYSRSEAMLPESNLGYNTSQSEIYNRAIAAAIDEQTQMLFSQEALEIQLKNCSIKFLSPYKDNFEQDNNYSAVIMLQYYNKKILFMGDAGEEIENYLIAQYGDGLKADVLKVAHHGSKTSTSKQFLDVVKPQYAMISASDNSSVHPNSEVMERLQQSGSEILSTAKIENFAITVNENCVIWQGQEKLFNFWAVIFAILLVACIMIIKLPFVRRDRLKIS